MFTDEAIKRRQAIEQAAREKREKALDQLREKISKEKNQLASERSLKVWEERRAKGNATLSDEAKNNIRIGMRDNHAGKLAVYERMTRLEAKLKQLGYSDDEVRAM